MSVKSLVAVLSFFVLSGKSKMASVQQRVSALHAAAVYLLLLGIPGEELKEIHRSKGFKQHFEDTSADIHTDREWVMCSKQEGVTLFDQPTESLIQSQ